MEPQPIQSRIPPLAQVQRDYLDLEESEEEVEEHSQQVVGVYEDEWQRVNRVIDEDMKNNFNPLRSSDEDLRQTYENYNLMLEQNLKEAELHTCSSDE